MSVLGPTIDYLWSQPTESAKEADPMTALSYTPVSHHNLLALGRDLGVLVQADVDDTGQAWLTATDSDGELVALDEQQVQTLLDAQPLPSLSNAEEIAALKDVVDTLVLADLMGSP